MITLQKYLNEKHLTKKDSEEKKVNQKLEKEIRRLKEQKGETKHEILPKIN